MSFSCRTQPPVMTLVPTYTFVGNLFQAFVMYAGVDLRGSRRLGLVLAHTLRKMNYHECFRLLTFKVKDVRAYANAAKENWVIAIDHEKGDLLLLVLSYRCSTWPCLLV